MEYKRKCLYCEENFVGGRSDKVYCSAVCKASEHHRKTFVAAATPGILSAAADDLDIWLYRNKIFSKGNAEKRIAVRKWFKERVIRARRT